MTQIKDIATLRTNVADTDLMEIEDAAGNSAKVTPLLLGAYMFGQGRRNLGYRSQYWYRFGAMNLGSLLTVLGTIYFSPMFIEKAVTLDKGALHPNAGQAGGVGLYGIYAVDPTTLRAGAMMIAGAQCDLSGSGNTATSNLTAQAGYSLTLQPGWYWRAAMFSATSTMPTVTGVAASDPWVAQMLGTPDAGTGNLSQAINGYTASQSYASGLPANGPTAGLGNSVAAVCPCPIFRAA